MAARVMKVARDEVVVGSMVVVEGNPEVTMVMVMKVVEKVMVGMGMAAEVAKEEVAVG